MVAEARDVDAIFFGGLEDGEVVVDLVGFVIDEYLYLFSGEGRVGAEQRVEGGQSQQHQSILI